MKAAVNILLFFASLAYPLSWLWENSGENLSIFGLFPFILSLLWGIKGSFEQNFKRYFAWGLAVLLFIIGLSHKTEMMYAYPMMINGLMLALFGSSLWQKQTIIERFARLQTPDLSLRGVRYTRKVTQLWCGFFMFNIAVSVITLYFNLLHYWALYNGVIAYVLMGILMAGEWIVRQYVKKQDEK